ncbi:MAG: class I SAM-dependent methyltransferase [Pseudomonadota bacterium]|nr:class I SAM-dependent methyltransferase [Pseudomonadota bacterium]
MTDAREWTGSVGTTWAAQWQRTDRSFANLALHLDAAILAAAPEAGRAIDIGCGAGATSLALAAARPALSITGIDLSPAMIHVARERAAGHPNLSFRAGGVEAALPGLAPADLLYSRHGVMFFDDPRAGFTMLRQAAKPGARLIFSCFRAAALNPWVSDVTVAILGGPPPRPAGYAPGPFAFADPAFVEAILSATGWQSNAPMPVDFTYRGGSGADPVADALDFFQHIGPAAPLLRAAPPGDRAGMIDRLRVVIERHATAEAVDFPAAAWLWSASAN